MSQSTPSAHSSQHDFHHHQSHPARPHSPALSSIRTTSSSRPSSPSMGSRQQQDQHGPTWHFPFGPSSKYHTRERSKSQLTQAQSPRPNYSYVPTAPTLTTELRSTHRRSRSSYNSPTLSSLTAAAATSPSLSSAYASASSLFAHPVVASSPRLMHPIHARSPLGRYSTDLGRPGLKSRSPHRLAKSSQPVTPAKQSHGRQTSSSRAMRDSPFSDYYTDEARSLDGRSSTSNGSSSQDMIVASSLDASGHNGIPTIAAATQHLLVRMAKLQSQLMRSAADVPGESGMTSSDTLVVVERKLNELDLELNRLAMRPSFARHARRPKSSLGGSFDSGLALEDGHHSVLGLEEEYEEDTDSNVSGVLSPFNESPYSTPLHHSQTTSATTASSVPANTPPQQRSPPPNYSTPLEHPSTALLTPTTALCNTDQVSSSSRSTTPRNQHFHEQMSHLLGGVTAVQAELRRRCAEVREHNATHRAHLAQQETVLEQLRGENEQLRADLGFEEAELLFLKLQMKGMEVDLSDGFESVAGSRPDRSFIEPLPQESARTRHNRILCEMDRWRDDWSEVAERFQRRKGKYGGSLPVVEDAAVSARTAVSMNAQQHIDEHGATWSLKVSRDDDPQRRVTSITITRVAPGQDILEQQHDGESVVEAPVTDPSSPERSQEDVTTNATPARKDAHGTTEAQSVASEAASKAGPYVDHSTQTDLDDAAGDLFELCNEHSLDHHTEDFDHVPTVDYEDECAITTSSESSEDSEEDADVDETEAMDAAIRSSRSAWEELWANLADFAGMGEE